MLLHKCIYISDLFSYFCWIYSIQKVKCISFFTSCMFPLNREDTDKIVRVRVNK